MIEWSSGATGAAGGLMATFLAWLLGKSDSSQQRRDAEARRVAREIISEAKIDVRLATIETQFEGFDRSLTENSALTRATAEAVNRIEGRLERNGNP